MSTVFYRKYRPHTFSEIQGQEHVKQVLVNSILNDSISHGYLFSGPRGTGKTSMARVLAKAVNSENFKDNKDVSDKDEHFKSITNGESVDIIEMDAASNRGIEDIRSLKESVSYLPSVLKYKVYIIDEAHMLTKEAFNALLKTLEEPPSHVIFVLATTEPHKIPVTILSRVVRFDFTLADKSSLKNKVDLIAENEKINISEEAFNKIFKISGGSFRDSESLIAKLSNHGADIDMNLVEEVLGIPSEEQVTSFIDLVEKKKLEELLSSIDMLETKNVNIKLFVEEVLEFLVLRYTDSGQSVKNLFSLFTEILSKLDQFNNPGLYLRSKLISSLAEGDAVVTQKLHEKPRQESSKRDHDKAESLVKKVEPEKAKDSQGSIPSTPDGFDMNIFLESVGEEDPRLEAVLEASDIRLDGNNCFITNEFQFNIKYISKDKSLKIIRDVISNQTGMSDVEVNAEQGTVESGAGGGNVGSIEDVEEVPVPEEPEKTEEVADNSDLVEELL